MIATVRRRLRDLRRALRLQSEFRVYLRPHRGRLAIVILLSALYASLRLLEPWPLQIVFDGVLLGKTVHFLGIDVLKLAGGDRGTLLALGSLALLGVASLSGFVYYIQSVMIARIGQDVVRSMREDVFHQLQRLSLPFHHRTTSGDLLMRLTGDMILLREMILASLVTLATQMLVLIAVLALMLTVSPPLTLVAVVLAPLLFLLFRSFRTKMVAAARAQRRREGSLASSLEEVLLSMPMIQAYTAEALEDERFRHLSKRSARAGLRGARLEAGMQRMVEISVALGTCLVLWIGARQVLGGSLTPGEFLVFLAYLRTLYRPVRGIAKVAERTARASAAAERVLEILRAKRETRDSKDAVVAPPLRGEIRFTNVGFTYENGTTALRDVSFHIRPGERIALVGPTGAGKSTLFALLLRFYRPASGRIEIDGRKVRHYTLASLRRQITLLPQEPFLVAATVRENLLYGKPEASDEELILALRAAALEDWFASLPHGLDTRIQSRGQSLSGGQRQRIAIARATLKDAPILLLDEPTTGLDARSEREVLDSLDRLLHRRTTITIAHRFSTFRGADRVLVLDRGELIEDGSPDRLLATDSLFRVLSEIQGVAASGTNEGRPSQGPREGTVWCP